MMNAVRLALAVMAVSAAGAARAACTIGRMAELPVTMSGMRPLVSASIDGKEARFLADSGAFYSIISPGSASQYGLRRTPAPFGFYVSGMGGRADATIAQVKDFGLAGQTIHNHEFLVAGSEIRNGTAGVLGQDILGLRDVEYDLAGGVIRLMASRDCEKADLAYWAPGKPAAVVQLRPIDQRNKHTIGTVFVNGVALRAMFDTGAPTSSLTLAAAARLGVHPGDPGVEPAGFGSGIGRGTFKTWTAPFQSFGMDGETIKTIRLRIADNRSDDFDMLVGADFFLSHHVYVANALRRMYLTYNGGPVFDLRARRDDADTEPPSAGAADMAAEPTDADGWSRRGAAFAARREYARAVDDFTHAVTLAPGEARYLLERADAHLALRQPLLAAADLDQAVALKPDLVEARIARAEMRLRANDPAGAHGDVDAAAATAPQAADVRLVLAALYARIDAFAPAIAQYDLWIAAHPDDSRRPVALNGRCWARALGNLELVRARQDCDAALRLRAGDATFLDSRGLVNLRAGRFDAAIADYDAALARAPKEAWSLYGRGIAEAALGQKDKSAADIAAAAVIAPALARRARGYGIVPPA